MYQRDYLMRLIEQMTAALGTIMKLRRERKFEEAGQAVDGLLHRLGLPGRQVLGSLAAEEIERLLEVNGEVEADKLFLAARLLREEADVRAEAGEPDEACFVYAKALRVLAMSEKRWTSGEGAIPKEVEAEAFALRERLRGRRLPLEACRDAARLFDRLERFELAENYWFEAAEAADGDEATIREGLRFYDRLLERDDGSLDRGALPRKEAQEGKAEYERRFLGGQTFSSM